MSDGLHAVDFAIIHQRIVEAVRKHKAGEELGSDEQKVIEAVKECTPEMLEDSYVFPQWTV